MYQKIIHFFGNFGERIFGRYTQPLKELVEKSNLPIIYEKYLGQLFFYSFLAFIVFLIYFSYLFYSFWGYTFLISLISALILSFTMTFVVATIFYFHPFYRYNTQLTDIDRNLPLAISYMTIISRSGVPPEKMFKYVADSKEFGEISKECGRIYKYLHIVGKDITSAIEKIATITPSDKFRNFLEGFRATILSGGDLNLYMYNESRKGIEVYREKQKRYTSIIGFFSDLFITIVLIAPLVLVVILTSFSLVESTILGYRISFLIKIITYGIVPIIGIIFLIILNRVRI